MIELNRERESFKGEQERNQSLIEKLRPELDLEKQTNQTLLSRICDLEKLALIGEKSTNESSELQKRLHELQENVSKPLIVKAESFDNLNVQFDSAALELTSFKGIHEKQWKNFNKNIFHRDQFLMNY